MVNRLLRPEDCAEILSCSRSEIFLLIRKGELTCIRIGRLVRVRQEDLEAFISANVKTKPEVFSGLFQHHR